jgi:hypothetical protein
VENNLFTITDVLKALHCPISVDGILYRIAVADKANRAEGLCSRYQGAMDKGHGMA